MSPAPRRLVALILTALLGGLLVSAPPALAATSGTVTGSVADASGTGANGAAYLYPAADPNGSGQGNYIVNGAFTLTSPPGQYKLFVRSDTMDGYGRWYVNGQPSGSSNKADATVIDVVDGATNDVGAMQLPAIATLQGLVTNADGDPMVGITVLRNRLGSGTSTTTDANGHYSFGYVQAGLTSISVNATGGWGAAFAQRTIDATTAYVVDLVMEAPAAIEGTVTDADSGDPVPWLRVNAYLRIGTTAFYQTSTRTDAAGHYLLEGVSAGDCVVQYVDDFGGYPTVFNGGEQLLAAAPALVTSGGSTLTHDEQVTQTPDTTATQALSGVVTAPTPSDQVVGVEVTAWAADGSLAGSALTDWSGRWGIDVPAGDYTVSVRSGSTLLGVDTGTPWFPAFYPDAWKPSDATPVTVIDDTDTHPGLDFSLGRSAVLTLDVRGPAGTTDLDGGYRVVAADGSTVYDETAVSGTGNVVEVLLRPGTWTLRANGRRTAGAALLPQWYGGNGSTRSSATPVSVVAGDEIDGGVLTLPAKLAPTTPPKLKGKAKVGRTLTATKGVWNLMTGTTFTFTWSRGGKVIGHRPAHTVTTADRGKKLTAKVTASNGDFVATRAIKVKIPR